MSKKRAKWSKINMVSAILAVRNKEYGFQKSAKLHGVPCTTLKRYVKKANDQNIDPKQPARTSSMVFETNLGRQSVFSAELEDELVEYCLKMEATYFGLRRKDVRRLAFQLAMRNNIRHPFSQKNNIAGRKWLKSFLKLHPFLSFRRPQRISVARAQAFTESNIKRFFDVLKPELAKVEFKPSRIFNVDETGITIVQHSSEKVLTLKGKREVHKLSSAERGGLITVVLCMSASGCFIPPMVIFPRKNRKADLAENLPDEAIPAYSKSGWITSQLFTQWFNSFVKFINANEQNPAVLVLDGHYSHTRNLDIIYIAREHHVSIVSLPPHTSGKTQPLDVSFMKAFKTYYAHEVENWMDSHGGRILTYYSIGRLFTAAYEQCATLKIAKSGFRRTGILPYNQHAFINDPKLIKDITDPKQSQTCTSASSTALPSTSQGTSQPSPLTLQPSTPASSGQTPSPISSPRISPKDIQSGQTPSPISSTHVSPEDIQPVPKIGPAPENKRRQKATIISGSPYKNFLERAEALRNEKEIAKNRRLEERKAKKVEKETAKQKKDEPKLKKNPAKKKKTEKKKRRRNQQLKEQHEQRSLVLQAWNHQVVTATSKENYKLRIMNPTIETFSAKTIRNASFADGDTLWTSMDKSGLDAVNVSLGVTRSVTRP